MAAYSMGAHRFAWPTSSTRSWTWCD